MDIASGLVSHVVRTFERFGPWRVAGTLVALAALLIVALMGGHLQPVSDLLVAAPVRW